MDGHVGDRPPLIFEGVCGSDEVREIEVPFHRRQSGALEPAHQGSRVDADQSGDGSDCVDRGSSRQQQFEQLEAILGCGGEANAQIGDGRVDVERAEIGRGDRFAEQAPSAGVTGIDDEAHATPAQGEQGLRVDPIGVGDEAHHRDARVIAEDAGHADGVAW